MKKISIIVTALVILVALTQCKKEQTTLANDGKTVDITLDIKGGNGTRMDVNTATGAVTYESGDKIYVASGGKYVGTLTHNGTRFGGAITDPVVGEPLHFYFLGNVTPIETLTAGTTTTCSMVISDQTQHLPVIEYAPSNENYTAGATTFTAHLLNKCALVKFNVTTASEATICVTGFNNKVTVNFCENTLTNSQEGNGVITLPAGNGEKWAILLPQEALEKGLAYSEDGDYTGTRGAVPTVYENGYFTVGIEVNLTTEVNPGEVPVGAISGKFTINADGDQVYFSQGNLQYQASTNTWRFAENQFDVIGSANNNISPTYDGWIDLFGWGTSGWNNGNTYYLPYNIESNYNSNTGYGYGPTDGISYIYGLTGNYANADWGIYNAILNGGNVPNQWRTLTTMEWRYVVYDRTTPSGILYAKGNVNNVEGMILLPDNWNTSVYALNYTNLEEAPYTANEISSDAWHVLESNGAVFIPAAGYRDGISVWQVKAWGNYWSSTCESRGRAYIQLFGNNTVYYYYDRNRNMGCSVRLVQDY